MWRPHLESCFGVEGSRDIDDWHKRRGYIFINRVWSVGGRVYKSTACMCNHRFFEHVHAHTACKVLWMQLDRHRLTLEVGTVFTIHVQSVGGLCIYDCVVIIIFALMHAGYIDEALQKLYQ